MKNLKAKVKSVGNRKTVVALLLISVVLAERLLFDLGPNVELVTAATFIAGIYLGFPYALIVPFASMALSDTVLGNSSIFWFTWSAYLISGCVALLARFLTRSLPAGEAGVGRMGGFRLLLSATVFPVCSSLFFFIWTNFGVWLEGWYSHTWQGLVLCYTMAIPFLKLNLYSNLLLVPSAVLAVEALKSAFVYSKTLITKISKVEV